MEGLEGSPHPPTHPVLCPGKWDWKPGKCSGSPLTEIMGVILAEGEEEESTVLPLTSLSISMVFGLNTQSPPCLCDMPTQVWKAAPTLASLQHWPLPCVWFVGNPSICLDRPMDGGRSRTLFRVAPRSVEVINQIHLGKQLPIQT